jgi:hypothetical protein
MDLSLTICQPQCRKVRVMTFENVPKILWHDSWETRKAEPKERAVPRQRSTNKVATVFFVVTSLNSPLNPVTNPDHIFIHKTVTLCGSFNCSSSSSLANQPFLSLSLPYMSPVFSSLCFAADIFYKERSSTSHVTLNLEDLSSKSAVTGWSIYSPRNRVPISSHSAIHRAAMDIL